MARGEIFRVPTIVQQGVPVPMMRKEIAHVLAIVLLGVPALMMQEGIVHGPTSQREVPVLMVQEGIVHAPTIIQRGVRPAALRAPAVPATPSLGKTL